MSRLYRNDHFPSENMALDDVIFSDKIKEAIAAQEDALCSGTIVSMEKIMHRHGYREGLTFALRVFMEMKGRDNDR